MLSCGRMIWLLPHPFSRQTFVSLSLSSSVSPVELTDGRGARSQIIQLPESLVLYKPFNTLWTQLTIFTPCIWV